jgi:hypothetical protein
MMMMMMMMMMLMMMMMMMMEVEVLLAHFRLRAAALWAPCTTTKSPADFESLHTSDSKRPGGHVRIHSGHHHARGHDRQLAVHSCLG